MATFGNYIQVVVRGLYNGQQWQISPTYTCTLVDGDGPPYGNFTFVQSSLAAWFVAYWNGFGAIPTNGLSDALAAMLPDGANVQEVRVYAKTNVMAVPEQAIIVGELLGTRGTTDQILPSYVALSCYARSLEYGRKGASMRLPILNEGDIIANEVTSGSRAVFQEQLLDRITALGQEAAFEVPLRVSLPSDEILDVLEVRPAAVQRVIQPGKTKPSFPYEGFANISAVECAPWTLNTWASTQNSRKFGRGR